MTTLVFSVVGALIMYPLLIKGGGLLVLVTINTCGFSLKYLLYGVMLTTRKYGCFRFRLADVSMETMRSLLSFGLKSFVWAFSLRIASLTDPLIIGAYLGAAIVPFYMIPYNFISQAKGLIWSITRIFLPAFSGLDALDQKDKTRELYFGASRYMLGIILPLVSGICLLGPSFLAHWMGQEYSEKGLYVLYIIAAAHLIQWINPFSRRFLMAIDRHEILAKVGIIGSLVNLGLSIIFVRIMGKEGVALGTLLPVLLVEPYLMYKTCKALDSSILKYFNNVMLPLLFPMLVFIFILAIAMTFMTIRSLLDVFLLAAATMSVYIPVFIATAMTKHERHKVRSKLINKFT